MANGEQNTVSIVNNRPHVRTGSLATALVFAVAILAAHPAYAQTLTVLHNFTGAQDGLSPVSGLTIDAAGNLYGTTYDGGVINSNCPIGCGVVFKMKRSGSDWIFTTLYQFQGGTDGGGPYARVIFGPDGALYGTTVYGGGAICNAHESQGCGTVFRLTPPASICNNISCPWTETILQRFSLTSSYSPYGEVAFDHAGNMYGTTYQGGPFSRTCYFGRDGCGEVWKLTPSADGWIPSVVYSFTGTSDGGNPAVGVIIDRSGNLYGTTLKNGTDDWGVVYQVTPSGSGWSENTIYTFPGGNGGAYPEGNLIFDPAGNLYGATDFGGLNGGGLVYQLSPSGDGWNFALVYGLQGFEQDGPDGGVTMDGAGNLYGTALGLGPNNAGLVFKLTPSSGGWTYTLLHQFGFSEGDEPSGTVVLDANGNLYGTAGGGAYGKGVVWEITP